MGDSPHDYHVQIMRFRSEVQGLEAQIVRHKLEIIEVKSRTRTSLHSIDSCVKGIKEKNALIKGLLKAHGEPPELDLDKLREELGDG